MNTNSLKTCTLLCFMVLIGVFGCKKGGDSSGFSTPVITSIAPLSAGNGDTVTLQGRNFGLIQSGTNLTINNNAVVIISSSTTLIRIIVPKLAGSGNFLLTSNGKTCESPAFTYKYKATVTTLAGDGSTGTNDGTGNIASFNCPWGISPDNAGNIYVADCYNRLIRKINTTTGSVSTITIPPSFDFYSPYNIAFSKNDNNLYVTDFNQHVMKISQAGIPS